jgi:putative flippase GtrA
MRAPEALGSLRSPVVRQFIKYGLVGVTNTLAYMAVYAIAVSAGVWYIAASALAFGVGATNGYLMNRSWTFRHTGEHRTTVSRYVVVQVGGLLTDLGLLWVLVEGLGMDKVVGQAIAIVLVVLGMFVANRYWTFAEALGQSA